MFLFIATLLTTAIIGLWCLFCLRVTYWIYTTRLDMLTKVGLVITTAIFNEGTEKFLEDFFNEFDRMEKKIHMIYWPWQVAPLIRYYKAAPTTLNQQIEEVMLATPINASN